MARRVPRFRLRTLLLAIALVATLLGLGLWYFTPRLRLRVIPERTTGPYDEVGEGVVEITNLAPRRAMLVHQASLLDLDIVVRDERGEVISRHPYWAFDSPIWPDPPRTLLKWGEAHREPVNLFRTLLPARPAPGTYTVEAVYHGAGAARSDRVTIRVLPGETYRWEMRPDPATGESTYVRVRKAP